MAAAAQAMAVAVPTKKAMIEWFGPVIHEYYAGSEGNGFVYAAPEAWLAHEGTVGTPINCVLHICGEDGEEVPQGESGTVFFEGGGQYRCELGDGQSLACGDERGRDARLTEIELT